MSLKQSAENAYFGWPNNPANTPIMQEVVNLFANVRNSFDTPALLLADTDLSYSAGTLTYVVEGDVIQAGDFHYTVDASGSSTNHVATAGGIKLLVSPLGGAFHVESFGAVGVGDETAIFQVVVDALDVAGGTIVLQTNVDYEIVVASVVVGSKKIRWIGDGATINLSEIWTLDGLQESFSNTNDRKFFNKYGSVENQGPTFDYLRNADYTDGVSTDESELSRWITNITGSVGSAGNNPLEKVGVFRVTNNSEWAKGIAGFFEAIGNDAGGIGSVSATSRSNLAPSDVEHRTAQFTLAADGADTNELREIVSLISHSQDESTYDSVDSVHVGLSVKAGTADMNYGVKIYDHAIKGEILDSAIHVRTGATNLLDLKSVFSAGTIRYGSHVQVANNVVAQLTGIGHNNAGEEVEYTQLQSVVNDPADGSEEGSFFVYKMRAGTMTKSFGITDDASDPTSIFVNGALKQILQAPDDSAGSGFAALKVAN